MSGGKEMQEPGSHRTRTSVPNASARNNAIEVSGLAYVVPTAIKLSFSFRNILSTDTSNKSTSLVFDLPSNVFCVFLHYFA